MKEVVLQEVELRKKPDIVVATPGRMIDHLRNTPGIGLEGACVCVCVVCVCVCVCVCTGCRRRPFRVFDLNEMGVGGLADTGADG